MFKKKKRFSYLLLTTTLLISACYPLSLANLARQFPKLANPRPSQYYRYNNNKQNNNLVRYKGSGYAIISKGDTVYAVARKYNVPVKTLIQTNRLKAPYILKIGQQLKLPPAPYHIVSKGDTLYSISRKYNVDMSSLARLNKIKSPYNLYLGQKLSLPGSIGFAPITIAKATKPTIQPQLKREPSTKTEKTPTTKSKLIKSKPKKKVYIPTPEKRSRWDFEWPIEGKIISHFGPQRKGRHNDGINISAKKGDVIKSAENGVVAYTGSEIKGYGNLILIKHSGGWLTAYAHTDKILVKRGEKVKRGQKIATVGNSGTVKEPQLHFEIRNGAKAKNPLKYMRKS